MAPKFTRTRSFLLSVVSASTLLPGCAQDHDDDDKDPSSVERDQAHDHIDGGVLAAPDAGPKDAGYFAGTVVRDAGLMVFDAGVVVADASTPDGAVVDAAADDACAPFILGIVSTPDASCEGYFPGFVMRVQSDE